MENEIRYLWVAEQEDRVAWCEISAIGERALIALTWERIADATLADPDLAAMKNIIETATMRWPPLVSSSLGTRGGPQALHSGGHCDVQGQGSGTSQP